MKHIFLKPIALFLVILSLNQFVKAQNSHLLCEVSTVARPNLQINLSIEDQSSLQSLKTDFKETQINAELFLILKSLLGEASNLAMEPATDDPSRLPSLRKRILTALASRDNLLIIKMKPELKSFLRETEDLQASKSTLEIELRNLVSVFKLSVAELKAKLGALPCGMTPNELFAIYIYTWGAFKFINPALRVKPVDEKYKSIVLAINNGLSKLGSYKGIAHRGGSLPASVLAGHQPGMIVTYDAFTSASVSAPFKSQFSFHIQSDSGKYIAPISIHPAEEEVLFPSRTKFLINSFDGKNFDMSE